MKIIKKKRYVAALAVLLIITFFLSFFMPGNTMTAYAQEYALTYDKPTAAGYQSVYSGHSSVNANINIPEVTGMKISKVELLKDNAAFMELTAPVGQTTWGGTQNLTGEGIDVISEGNKTTQGYYAWYRYGTTDPDKRWFANVIRRGGIYEELRFGTVPPDPADPAYPTMPAYPNISDDRLIMSGIRTAGFTIKNTGVSIDSSVVQRTPTNVDVQIENTTDIPSLEGIAPGRTDYTTRVVDKFSSDIDSFEVQYGQDFDHEGKFKNLATPGAKVMVYYAAFLVNIESKTYRYPDKVKVTYTPIDTSKPDLAPLELKATTSISVGTPTTFQYKFTNYGKSTSPTGFAVKVTDVATGTVVHTKSFGPLDKNVEQTGSFAYTFASSGSKIFEIFVDSNNAIDEGAFEGNNKLSATFSVATGITGDFDIVPSTINFNDPFKLVPNINTTAGCTYTDHTFKMTRASSSWTSPKQTNKSQELSFSKPSNYPAPPIGLGSVTVAMKAKGTCGETDWIEKTLTVNGTNSPPYFKIGWFMDGDNTSRIPLTQVLQGARIQARIIQDPSSTPPSPSDPENDNLTFAGWDFNRTDTWVKNLPTVYGFVPGQESLRSINADTVGAHGIYATIMDSAGASYTSFTMIEIIPPNPIPVAACPPVVKEYRPVLASAFSAAESYSPANRAIDHARDEWTNKLSSYVNGTSSDITVQASLHVWDNGSPALKSLDPDICTIVVQPDLPPIGKLDVPPYGIRNQSFDLYNKSYSVDGDVLVSATYRYKYDAANDGFANDGWITLPGGTMTKVTFTPSKVGKYLLDVTACEDYGKCGTASTTQVQTTLTMDVLNLAPNVEFTISGLNNQPDLNPLNTYSANTMFGWNLYETNSTNLLEKKSYSWSTQSGALLSGLGKHLEVQYPLSKTQWTGQYSPNYNYSFFSAVSDGGFGPNGFTPYKGMTSIDSSRSQPLLLPPVVSSKFVVKTPVDPAASLQPYQWSGSIQTTKSHLYFWAGIGDKSYLMAYNKSRIPTYSSYSTPFQNGSQTQYEWTHHWANGVNPYDLAFPAGGGTVLDSQYPKVSLLASGGYPDNVYYDRYAAISKFTTTLVGDKIYVLYSVAMPNSLYWGTTNYCDENGDCYDYQTYLTRYDPPKMHIAQFDAVTGDLLDDGKSHPIPNTYNATYGYYTIGSMTIYTYNMSSYTMFSARGNNLQIIARNSYDGQVNSYAIISPDGTIVKSGSLVIPSFSSTFSYKYKNMFGQTFTAPSQTYSCQWLGPYGASGPFWDDENNPMGYMNVKCYAPGQSSPTGVDQTLNPDVPVGMYLVKFDLSTGSYVISAKLAGDNSSYSSMGPYDFPMENDPALVYNPFTKVAYTRSFIPNNSNGTVAKYYEVVMMDGSGSKWGSREIANWINYWPSPFYQTPSGATGEGWCTYTASGTCESYDQHASQRMWWKTGFFGADERKTTAKTYGQFVGDGLYMSMYSGNFLCSCGSSPSYDRWVFLDVGPVNTNEAYKGFRIGQFSSDTSLADAEINFTMNMRNPQLDSDLAGMSFRMADPRNRYAVETDGSNLYLSRYIGGARAVLQSVNWPAQSDTDYSIKIRTTGNRIEVLVGGVPYFDVTDGTFPSGKFGPFADKPGVGFKAVSSKVIQALSGGWLTNYAIWESGNASATVRYDTITYTDPESDPISGSFRWTYTHTPKFMSNQGVSALNGQTFTSERLTFDKVGEYWISLQARDDPHPDYRYPSMVFDGYRKNSNAFQQRLIVHRRPIAILDPPVIAGNGTITWTDQSYDPDRWVNASTYSAPDTTGINYGTTRGIMERKYFFVSPSGAYVESKLTRPTENGTYTVGLAVRDEYGAWSYPSTQTVTVGNIPIPNVRPTATLTSPNGSQATPNLIYTQTPTITWNQNDSPGTIFAGYHVKISDEAGRIISESGESPQWTYSTSGAWTVPTNLPIGIKLQVQVRVSDGEEWSVWSNIGWMIVNSPPTVVLTYPNGTQAAPNLIQDNRRPTITWNQYDADLYLGTYFQGYHVQVLNESGALVYEYSAGQYTQSNSQSLTVTADLPTGVKLQVRTRVHDGAAWSEWSNVGWLKINMSPGAVVTYPFGTQASPTLIGSLRPTIYWNQTDPDPDTVFLKYQLLIVNEANTATLYDSGEMSQNTSNNTQSMTIPTDLPAGTKLRVRVRVFDGYVWSPWSADTWMQMSVNYEVVKVDPKIEYYQPRENRPDIEYFLVGERGVASYDVHVKVRKTLGSGSDLVTVRLTVEGYNRSLTFNQTVSVGTTESTVIFTNVPNITEVALQAYHSAEGPMVYSTLIHRAEIISALPETTYGDNKKAAIVKTGEKVGSQLIQ